MEYLKFLPIPSLVGWIAAVFLSVRVIEFFVSVPAARLIENSRASLIRKIIGEALIFIMISLMVLCISYPSELNFISTLGLFILILITFGLSTIYNDSREGHNKYQLKINRVIIKLFGKKAYRWYGGSLFLIHMILLISFYRLMILGLLEGFQDAYNIKTDNSFEILYFMLFKNIYVVYFSVCLLIILYFMARKMYMHPFKNFLDSIFTDGRRVSIKLTSGEVLKDLYIINTSDTKFLLVSKNPHIQSMSTNYHINKDKIEYIEVHSKEFSSILYKNR